MPVRRAGRLAELFDNNARWFGGKIIQRVLNNLQYVYVGCGSPRTLAAMVMRFLRWNPENYWQVWLLFVAPSGVLWLIIWSAFGKPPAGLVLGGIITLGYGAGGSYRLGRRRDASTAAEWASTRRRPPPTP